MILCCPACLTQASPEPGEMRDEEYMSCLCGRYLVVGRLDDPGDPPILSFYPDLSGEFRIAVSATGLIAVSGLGVPWVPEGARSAGGVHVRKDVADEVVRLSVSFAEAAHLLGS